MKIEPARVARRRTSPCPATSRSRTARCCSAAIADGESAIEGFGRSGRHRVDDRGRARARRRGRRGRTTTRCASRRRAARPARAGRADRLRQRGHADAAARPGSSPGRRAASSSTATSRCSSRPMERIAEPLRQMGARVETTDGHAPLVDRGRRAAADPLRAAGRERAGEVGRPARRAARGRRRRRPSSSRCRRATTPSACSRAPACARAPQAGPRSRSRPSSGSTLGEVEIPGDFSSAAPFDRRGDAARGLRAVDPRRRREPARTGLLDVLERMGAHIAVFNRRRVGGEPVADLEVRSAELVGDDRSSADEVPRLIDELPLFALAAVHGARRQRRPRRRGAAREGDGPDRDCDDCAASPRRRASSATDDGFTVRGVPTRPRGGEHRRARRPPARDARRGRRARLARGRARSRAPRRRR